ncbi:hypothetical protein OF001_U10260 [Pseudomonas sp. OF001]|nr:hypothetical protein OF001_U10260 [Pseudomonas sp. OF001]
MPPCPPASRSCCCSPPSPAVRPATPTRPATSHIRRRPSTRRRRAMPTRAAIRRRRATSASIATGSGPKRWTNCWPASSAPNSTSAACARGARRARPPSACAPTSAVRSASVRPTTIPISGPAWVTTITTTATGGACPSRWCVPSPIGSRRCSWTSSMPAAASGSGRPSAKPSRAAVAPPAPMPCAAPCARRWTASRRLDRGPGRDHSHRYDANPGAFLPPGDHHVPPYPPPRRPARPGRLPEHPGRQRLRPQPRLRRPADLELAGTGRAVPPERPAPDQRPHRATSACRGRPAARAARAAPVSPRRCGRLSRAGVPDRRHPPAAGRHLLRQRPDDRPPWPAVGLARLHRGTHPRLPGRHPAAGLPRPGRQADLARQRRADGAPQPRLAPGAQRRHPRNGGEDPRTVPAAAALKHGAAHPDPGRQRPEHADALRRALPHRHPAGLHGRRGDPVPHRRGRAAGARGDRRHAARHRRRRAAAPLHPPGQERRGAPADVPCPRCAAARVPADRGSRDGHQRRRAGADDPRIRPRADPLSDSTGKERP